MPELSTRQQEELNESIYDYLIEHGYKHTAETFQQEGSLLGNKDNKERYSGLLARKWTSVVRLQKKITLLEEKNEELTKQLESVPVSRKNVSQVDTWIPSLPASETFAHAFRESVSQVALHPLYTIGSAVSQDMNIKVWDWMSGELERAFKAHTKSINDVDFSCCGKYAVTCSSDTTCKIWEVHRDWKLRRTLQGHFHTVSSCRFIPHMDLIVTASRDQDVRIWDIHTGLCTTIISFESWILHAEPHPDFSTKKLVAAALYDHTACIYTSEGKRVSQLLGHEHVVQCITWAPAEANDALSTLAAAPKGRVYVATCSRDKTIRLWDVTHPMAICVKVLEGHDNWVGTVVFHPSGKWLISASDDKTVRFWELSTGRCIRVLQAHDHFVTGLAFRSQKNHFAMGTGSADGEVKFWVP